jgi:hypothetical protein
MVAGALLEASSKISHNKTARARARARFAFVWFMWRTVEQSQYMVWFIVFHDVCIRRDSHRERRWRDKERDWPIIETETQ